MLSVAAKRLAGTLPLILLVLLVIVVLLEVSPGDPATYVAGDQATPAQIAQVRRALDLDKPLPERYVDYVGRAAHGDLGRSFFTKQKVVSRITEALPITIALTIIGMILAIILGLAVGTMSALHPDSVLDRILGGITSLLIAVPPFVTGLAIVVFFALEHRWFPAGGYVPMSQGLWQWLKHLLLPATALALLPAAELARQSRRSLIEVFDQDYIMSLRARGLPRRKIISVHAFRNAALPVVTVLGLQVGRILGGSVVIERVYALPGFGSLAFDAVQSKDIPVIQGVVLFSALIVLVVNLAVDLSYSALNPKLRK
jgi:peptide/nickel transport system permease protein